MKARVYVGREDVLRRPRKLFDEEVVDFLDTLSKKIREHPLSTEMVDLMAFAFWIRKSQILKWKETRERKYGIGRGIAFHIAPSNVPMNFAYSMVFGLLSGNSNIIRLSSKEFPQVDLFCEIINDVLKDYPKINEELCILRYEHDNEITEKFTKQCDVRVIWGGDETIVKMRKFPLKPRTVEINFANRISLCLVGSDDYVKKNEEELAHIARLFYNDTYYSDQMACSSPIAVIFIGNENEKASKRFWEALAQESRRYSMDGVRMVEKYSLALEYFSQYGGKMLFNKENLYVVDLKEEIPLTELKGRFGLFYTYQTDKLEWILPLCTSSLQSVLYTGLDKETIYHLIEAYHLSGIDRIAPIGEGLSMDLIWDGYDIITAMSRIITVK